jgi:glycosyltransferase involved in cell wall biosynthesis
MNAEPQPNKAPQPKVTVLVMTYNHERFIAQALESVLMQQTDFGVEILISEDCSTDRTRAIVLDYHARFPQCIRVILSERNLHSNQVVVRGIEAARGQYIALLDGDDYWLVADKLQKQADFLDAHAECAICFHNATVLDEEGRRAPWQWTPPNQKPIATLDDLWMGNFIATASTMFRRGLIRTFPAWYDALFPITDWPLHILNAEQGNIGYLHEVMSVYRYHAGGYYSPLSEERKLQETLKFYRTMDRNLDYRYTRLIHTAISKYFYDWAREYAKRGDWRQARACLHRCLRGRPFNPLMQPKALVKLAARIYLSSLVAGRTPRLAQGGS